MRYPAYLKKNGTIGFVAPSFGCATEPYKSAFESALAAFHEMGYQTMLGPNCYAAEGLGISNTPQKCAAELQQMYETPENNILLSCGGGELMCEILPYIDWEVVCGLFGQYEFHFFADDNGRYSIPLCAMCGCIRHEAVAQGSAGCFRGTDGYIGRNSR